jgi:hypothetical protein
VAFVVMPFGKKPTGLLGDGVPSDVAFDALWERVYRPVLTDMGYNAVRADRDVGALIVNQMVQRLALANLIVADVTLPNANVYYEIGVRHAASERGCVLASADWAKPVFDLAQMRQIRFPLADGGVDEASADVAAAALREQLAELSTGVSPVFDAVPGYPGDVDPRELSAFEDFVAELSEFQAEARGVREAARGDRPALAADLVARYGSSPAVLDSVALELLLLLRDYVGWKAMVAYGSALPPGYADRHPVVREQLFFAMAQAGDPKGLGGLSQLADESESSERRGLLGGRYKKLWSVATDEVDKRGYLDKAIEQYELGMNADLNAYYPSSNLPRLYRSRGDEGDEQKAAVAATIALAACHRALARGADDGWLRPTLLGAAFDAGDVDQARGLVPEIRRADSATWKLQSTVADLRVSVRQQVDPEVTAQLQAVLDDLEALAGPASP